MDDDDDIDEFVTITARPSERTANEVARVLVEHGLGAVVEPITTDEPVAEPAPEDRVPASSEGSSEGSSGDAKPFAKWAASAPTGPPTPVLSGFAVRVMRHQAERASEVLGIELPATVAAAVAAEEREPSPPWKRILLTWAAAMVIIPVVAGLAAYFLFSR
jgi:hypothetical protein